MKLQPYLCRLLLFATLIGAIACNKEEPDNTPTIEEEPAIEAFVVAGDYHFQSAEYLNPEGEVTARGYDTFHIEVNDDGSYTLTGLLYSSVRWDGFYDETNSQLCLSGCGWKSDSEGNWSDNEGRSWFSILTNRGILSTDASGVEHYGLYGLFSFTSQEAYHAPDGDPQAICRINVDPKTGVPTSFATLLSCECWACDEADSSLPAAYAGTKGYAIPGTEIAAGKAAKEYEEVGE